MSPNLTTATALFLSASTDTSSYVSVASTSTAKPTPLIKVSPKPTTTDRPDYRWQIVWRNVLIFIYLHGGTLYGIWLVVSGTAKFATFLWAVLIAAAGAVGITAGAHRLWAHRSYKAKWPLRLILAAFQTVAFQNHIYEWVRDHRVHHKFSDTDADPHNASRGFFFSHIGWLMVRKHRDVMVKGKKVDMSDLEKDPIVVWQMRTYLFWTPLLCFAFPTWVPVYFWGEAPWVAWYVAGIMRYTLSLNGTWLVNSAAHIWGMKPFDKNINPAENKFVAVVAFGEGWHNYHHVFPWDYKAAELGNYRMNFTTAFIDFFARIGWAYDLKTVSEDMVRKRAKRTGDGTHPSLREPHEHGSEHHHHEEESIWGWGDLDMADEDMQDVQIANKGD